MKARSLLPVGAHAAFGAIIVLIAGCAHAPLRHSTEHAIILPTNPPPEMVAPRPLRTLAAEFPPEMQRAGISGEVRLNCLIDERGSVREIAVAGYADRRFSESAIDAVRRWSFAPGTVDGTPTAMRVIVPVSFTFVDNEEAGVSTASSSVAQPSRR